jgi:hypothetical protein
MPSRFVASATAASAVVASVGAASTAGVFDAEADGGVSSIASITVRACLFSWNWAELEFDSCQACLAVPGIGNQLSTHFPSLHMKSTSDSSL